jgi:hypothetical protein
MGKRMVVDFPGRDPILRAPVGHTSERIAIPPSCCGHIARGIRRALQCRGARDFLRSGSPSEPRGKAAGVAWRRPWPRLSPKGHVTGLILPGSLVILGCGCAPGHARSRWGVRGVRVALVRVARADPGTGPGRGRPVRLAERRRKRPGQSGRQGQEPQTQETQPETARGTRARAGTRPGTEPTTTGRPSAEGARREGPLGRRGRGARTSGRQAGGPETPQGPSGTGLGTRHAPVLKDSTSL